jgi:ceramide glucosyltransferase
MNEIIVCFLILAIIFSTLHLFASAIIITLRTRKDSNNFTSSENQYFPSISILKPLKGIDDALEENIRSFFKLDYPNYEIIFGLDSYRDPSLKIIRKLQAEYKNVKSKLVVNDYSIGLNPKVNNLNNMCPFVESEFILINDSNTRVAPDFLKKLILEFNTDNVGLVTATIKGIGAKNVASVWENLHLNTFVAPNVFLAKQLADISIVIGKSILMPKKVLNEIGGFSAIKNYLAEDFWLGIKVKELGYEIKTSLTVVENVNEKISFKKFLNRHSRWAKMRRNIEVKHYLLEWFSNPVLISALLIFKLQNLHGVIIALSVISIKILHDYYVLRLMKSDLAWYNILAVPIKDIIISLIWLTPFFSYKVKWRNTKIRIGKGSLLQSI